MPVLVDLSPGTVIRRFWEGRWKISTWRMLAVTDEGIAVDTNDFRAQGIWDSDEKFIITR